MRSIWLSMIELFSAKPVNNDAWSRQQYASERVNILTSNVVKAWTVTVG